MKKFLLLFTLLYLLAGISRAQVSSTYTFTGSSGTFTEITGGIPLATGAFDDQVYNANEIGFEFNFNGGAYTQFSVCANGWLCIGATAVSSLNDPISGGTSNDVIAAVGHDIQGLAANSEIRYQVLGSYPDRALVVQWLHVKKYAGPGIGDDWNFQIILNETSNKIDIVYGGFTTNTNSTTVEVGIRGASNADYNNRTTTTDWANTTAGTSNAASCSLTSAVYPASGQTFTWTMLPCTGTPTPGNTLSSANPACSGVPFTLSLQNSTPGAGVTYQWAWSSDGVGWTYIGYGPTISVAQTTAHYYECVVTCAGNMGISAPLQVTMNPFYNCYCPSIPLYLGDEEIYSVTVGGFINAYDCYTVAPGPGSILNRYSNFYPVGSLCNLPQSGNIPFTVEENECDGPPYYINGCAIWVDFNQDGDFTDDGEQVYSEAATTISPRTITGNIAVPAGATLGETAMRITVAEGYCGAGLTPCLSYGFGETEDYRVTITVPIASLQGYVYEQPACTSPLAGATVSNGTYTTLTNSAGFYQIYGIPQGSYDFTASKTGYVSQTISGITITNGVPTDENFCLTFMAPPSNLQAAVSGPAVNNVNLTWDPPPGPLEQWMMWDDGTIGGVLYIGDPFIVASRWTIADISPYGGMYLKKIRFYVGTTSNFTLKVWKGANAATPLYSQTVTPVFGWNEFTLTPPVLVDGTQEFWFGYEINSGGNFARFDNGPPIEGKGNMIYWNGAWTTLSLLDPTTQGNWIIHGSLAPTVTGYNVYRNNAEIADNIPAASYDDPALSPGGYDYQVSARYVNGGESAKTGAVHVNIYCSSMASNTDDEEIYSVTVAGNTNAYNCTTIAPGPGSILNRYSNFYPLGSLCNLPQSGIIPFTVVENECDGEPYWNNGCAIWVDFNQDGDFTDPGEQVYSEAATTQSPRTITGNIAVPAGATPGVTKMRITIAEGYCGAALTPCLDYYYGETEDYMVTITVPSYGTLQGYVYRQPACTTPIEGATVSNGTYTTLTNATGFYQILNLPVGTYNFKASLTGFTYQTVTGITITSGGTTSQDFCLTYMAPPSNLQAVVSGPAVNNVNLTWNPPPGPPEQWIMWDDGTHFNDVGLVGGGTFYVASRWPVADISPYGGMYLKKIRIYAGEAAATYTLKVWKGVNAATPLLSQAVTITTAGWNEFTLTSPVQIDGTQEFWFGYEVTSADGTYPFGIDNGPNIEGKGNMIGWDGGWTTLYSLNPSLTYNWNIHGWLASASRYNVYRNNVKIASNIPDASYDDPTLPPGGYDFQVSAKYDGGESAKTGPVHVNIYCSSMALETQDEEIYNVTVAGNTNAYNCTTVAPGPGSILNQYSNFYPLGSFCDLPRSGSIPFTVEENECDGAPYYYNGCAIWVDFNQDGDFTDEGEQVYSEATTALSPRTITGNIAVPAGATPGLTTMRITVAEGVSGATLTPCMSYGFGETEDYLVTINSPPCEPVTVLPWSEGWETGCTDQGTIDGCWTQAITGPYSWVANSSRTTYNRTPRTGSFNATLQFGGDAWLFRNFTLEACKAYRFSLYARQDMTIETTIEVNYGTSKTIAGMTSTIIPTTAIVNAGYQLLTGTFTVPSNGNYYIGVHGVMGKTPWYLSIDDLSLEVIPSGILQGYVYEEPACTSPLQGVTVSSGTYSAITDAAGFYQICGLPMGSYNFTASHSCYTSQTINGIAITSSGTTTRDFCIGLNPPSNLQAVVCGPAVNNVNLTWNPPLGCVLTGYNVYRNNVKIADNIPNASYDDLAVPSGGYDYQVSAKYVNGSESARTGTAHVNIYCSSMASYTQDEDIFSVTVAGNTNAYNCTTVAPGPGSILNRYSNFYPLGPLCNLPRSGDILFTIEENECDGAPYYYNGCAIWIDFNRDGDFMDAGEQVYSEATTTLSPRTITGYIAVPAGATPGVTTMRITVAEGAFGATVTPCLSYGWGETEDYLVTITPLSACPQPFNVNATAITPNSANLSWTPGGTETAWEYSYGVSPFPAPTGPGTVTSSATVNPLSGLSPHTTYQFWVRANCGTAFSDWTGPVTFATPCDDVSLPPWNEGWETGYTDQTTIDGCWTQEIIVPYSYYWVANSSQTEYNRTPRTGLFNATLSHNGNAWLFRNFALEACKTYKFSLYARQNMTDEGTIEVGCGTTNNSAGMTHTIIPSTAIVNGDYQLLTGTFTVPTDGNYYIGVHGIMGGILSYISMDDLSLEELSGTLQGHVYESLGCTNPLQGVTVTNNDGLHSALTDAAGFYRICGLPAGTYDFTASLAGYISKTTGGINITSGATTTQDFCIATYCAPPSNLQAVVSGPALNDVNLTWNPPPGSFPPEQWIKWDDGTHFTSVGLTAGGTFIAASRWPAADISPYGGMYLKKIRFYANDAAATYTLKVWKGVNATTLLLSQPVTTVAGWNEFMLTPPVHIDGTQEFWFGYEVTHTAGTHPAGCDVGPNIEGKGNMFGWGGSWYTLYGINSGLTYNWNIHGWLVPAVAGYNVYRNNVEIAGNIPNTSYDDLSLSPGGYDYQVSAMYVNSGESAKIGPVHIDISPPPPPAKTLNLKVYLESLFNPATGLMRLAMENYALQTPHFGTGIADQVTVELRATTPSSSDYAFSNVNLNIDGTLAITTIPATITGFYYIVIRHRNSIETWSMAPVALGGAGPFNYDFTTAASNAYGNNMKLMGTAYVIYGGDAWKDEDEAVDGSDMAAVDNASTSVLIGYDAQDVTGDGIVDGSDMAMVDNNSTAIVHAKKPYNPPFVCGSSITINHLVSGGVSPVNKSVTYGTVKNIPGETSKCWITSNLGADYQANAKDDARETSAGWYWQFNRKQGYKHDGTTRTPNTAWISSISENSDWIPANDPCALELGTGWRIPTLTEWTNVDASGNWTDWNSPWNSGLKLHAAGGLGWLTGDLFARGSFGYYWSSKEYDASDGRYLDFYNNTSYMTNTDKAYGFPLRCLTDAGSSAWSCGSSITVDHVTGAVAPVDKTVTYGTVTNIPGEPSKCWITSNLGADHQATAVGDATEASAGWYWQFNRKQGYKHDGTTRTPNTTWITDINENSDWQAANDPCTLELGPGWRIPTGTEWYDVYSAGNWQTWTDPWNSGLKLHAAGYLWPNDGTLGARGGEGPSWSSSQADNEHGSHLTSAIGVCLWLIDIKPYAFPLRCLINTYDFDDDGILNENDNCPYNWNPLQEDCNGNGIGDVCDPAPCPWVCGNPLPIAHLVSHGVAPVDKTVTYGTVTNIPGEPSKCWITSNLGADHQATAVDDVTEPSAGWYWQFNFKQGYKHDGTTRTPGGSWINSINENSDWTATNDPCTLELGSGWRIPTSTEWINVDASGGWTNLNGPWTSDLKMHAAGYLHSIDGSLYSRGSIGDYWSMTQYDVSSCNALGFNNTQSNMFIYTRAFGLTLRCLKE